MSYQQQKDKIVFVTVGTTQFDALMEATCQDVFLDQLVQDGFTKLILQYGRGRAPCINTSNSLKIECFDFSPSLHKYMACADVILCHAGAGSIMEALSLQKHTIVVINHDLMDNHQLELAHALEKRNHIAVISQPHLLSQQWKQVTQQSLLLLPNQSSHSQGKNSEFVTLLQEHMGFPV